uniref:Small ribosomal subunit protein uS7c n=1 Tax=Lepocinclis playfairiana TaxID=1403386 RepID=A0A3G3LLI2_9EUGL|nr:ribosomal protein S7 [Lepocinclis playfairiana]AYQ93566.1 ribosomal protein S7 [Lepocinclis playfairiana]
MSRRKNAKKRTIKPDAIYNSIVVSMIINKILKNGKKALAERILYESIQKVKDSVKDDPLKILEKAITNATPVVELKSRRVGGATYQVPIEIKKERGTSIALTFLIKSARKRPGKNMIMKLGNEIIDAYNNTGTSVKKKEELHRMAETNKAFANFK